MSSNAASKKSGTKPDQNPESQPKTADKLYPVLDQVNTPTDMKPLSDDELIQLCDDVRNKTIDAVSQTGGHLGAGLGVVELTVAIHAVFDTPDDRLIFDVGHQCYPHKILTGRKDRIETIRQGGGLSGFTKRSESEYDPFGAAHSSTSISAGLGMAVARDLGNKDNHVVCVIGDSAMSGGMAFEAMNNAGNEKSRLVVILNDNDMSIARPTGALNKYLTRLISSKSYYGARETGKKIADVLPAPIRGAARRAEESARTAIGKGTLFEELGFYYIGPIDGHDMNTLLPILRNIKDGEHKGPILIHAMTKKGKGYMPAETASDKMHGVAKFDVVTGAQFKPKSAIPSYTKVFSDSLIKEAHADDKVVAITAAMPDGTGLTDFGQEFPNRMFDVGIAEQHAVTFAGGLATEGYKPFCAIYSTFLQRAYDQVIHDIALQNLPVRFAIDRAGLVGADGQTHAGSFDITYLGCLPNMVLMAASDEAELVHMVHTAAKYDDGPIAFRYPRGNGTGVSLPEKPETLPIGKGRIVQSHGKKRGDIALLSYGCRLTECLEAAQILTDKGFSVTVADARFAKPLDTKLIETLTCSHKLVMTVEAGSVGGFGSMVLNHMMEDNLLDGRCIVKNMNLPDIYQDHDAPDKQYKTAGLDAAAIAKKAQKSIK